MKNNNPYNNNYPETRILFHYAYSDYEGSYLNNGWFIDNAGRIRAYSTSLGTHWSFPNEDIYSENQLLANYQQADFSVEEVSMEKLNEMHGLLSDFRNGPFSNVEFEDEGEGTEAFYCFEWDPVNKLYRRILLVQSGDFKQENRHPYARLVLNWMKTVKEKVFAKYAMVN